MDIANYLSELLNRHNEVSVPGLGCFSRIRVNGYYNDAEARFYPPRYQLQFEQQDKGDDVLVSYIAAEKKISLASSKYFTEKYINNLKQEIAMHHSPLADLGWFHMVDGKIAFKPNEGYNKDVAFYGLSPLTLHKADHNKSYTSAQPVIEQQDTTELAYTPPPVVIDQQDITEPAHTPALPIVDKQHDIINEPEQVVDEPETTVNESGYAEQESAYIDDEYIEHRGLSTWVIVLLVIFIIASAVLTIYKFNPELLDRFQQKPDTEAVDVKPVIPADTLKKDTPAATPVTKAISTQDSTLSKSVTGADTNAKPVFVIFLASFKTEKKSEEEIKKYKDKKVDAYLLTGPGTGRLKKVVTGSFATSAEAEIERRKLVAAKKIDIKSYTRQINSQR